MWFIGFNRESPHPFVFILMIFDELWWAYSYGVYLTCTFTIYSHIVKCFCVNSWDIAINCNKIINHTMNTRPSHPLNNRICSKVTNTTQIRSSFQAHITTLSPILTPPILQDPVLFRVANQEHCVVQGLWNARRIIVDTIAVQLEGPWRSINTNR